MKRQDLISGLFFLAFSIAICIQAFRMNIGTLTNPAQGSLPFLAGACLGGFSCWLLVRFFKSSRKPRPQDDLKEYPKGIRLGRVLLVLCVLVCSSLVLSFLGFGATTFLFFVFFFGAMARMAWWKVLLGSAAVSIISYLFFVVWLQCQLPSGFLGY